MTRRDALKTSGLALGYAVSASALSALFLRCQAEAKKAADWKPVFLSPQQAHTIGEIAETILPKTDTPGAKELGVPQFIDQMLKDLMSPEDQADFLAGLKQLEDTCEDTYDKPFAECNVQQREEFLLKLDNEAAKSPPSVWGITLAPPSPTPFFRRLKSLTLFGYFSTEKVGTEILSYDPIPMGYIGCLPLSEVGNAWTEG